MISRLCCIARTALLVLLGAGLAVVLLPGLASAESGDAAYCAALLKKYESYLDTGNRAYFGNAGTGTRLMMGVVGGHAIKATFDGDASLRKRPMRRILDPLALMGVNVVSETDGGRCPITIQGTGEPAPMNA